MPPAARRSRPPSPIPATQHALAAAVEAAEAGLIAPILVGPETRILRAAAEAGADIAPFRLVPAPHSHAAAAAAVALVRAGEARLLMKGSLHTDELMHEVMASRYRAAHRAPDQPCLSDGRADAIRARC